MKCSILLLLPLAAPAIPQSLPAGNWDVTSTAVDLVVPGAPGFMLRMMRGRSKVEHKCVAPEQVASDGRATQPPLRRVQR